MATSLDDLLRLNGVVASGEFSPSGKLIAFRSNGAPLADDVALLTAQFAAAVSQLLGVLAAPIPESADSTGFPSRVGPIAVET